MLKINSATASAKMIPNKILLSHIVLIKHSQFIPRFEWSLVIMGNARNFPADASRGVLRLLALVARFAKHFAAVEDNCPNRQTILGTMQPNINVVDINAKATANGLNVRITSYYFLGTFIVELQHPTYINTLETNDESICMLRSKDKVFLWLTRPLCRHCGPKSRLPDAPKIRRNFIFPNCSKLPAPAAHRFQVHNTERRVGACLRGPNQ